MEEAGQGAGVLGSWGGRGVSGSRRQGGKVKCERGVKHSAPALYLLGLWVPQGCQFSSRIKRSAPLLELLGSVQFESGFNFLPGLPPSPPHLLTEATLASDLVRPKRAGSPVSSASQVQWRGRRVT